MLSNSNISNKLSLEAFHITCYLINKNSFAIIKCKTPQERWNEKLDNYNNISIFGCPPYYHINKGRLEPCAKEGIFLGYPDR